MHRETRWQRITIRTLLVLGTLPVLLPLYWLVLSSVQSRESASSGRPRWLPVDQSVTARIGDERVPVTVLDIDHASGMARVRPLGTTGRAANDNEALQVPADAIETTRTFNPRFDNYTRAWREQAFGRYVLNTILVAALVVLGTVLSCGLVAYGFARFDFPGRDALFMLLLATLMIPGQVTSIPTFVLYARLGWIDSYLPLIVPAWLAQSGFFVFLFRQYMLTLPVELEDAARIDGCGPLATWWLVMMPLCRPVAVTVAVFAFVGVWNDFLGPLLYINSDEKQLVSTGLQNFKSAYGVDDPQLLMAASVMMMAPSLLLFLVAQRAFLRGVVVTGSKG